MEPESDSVRLVDYNFPNKRSSRKRPSQAVSDSELDRENGKMFETTLCSDSCDENLPSVRAHLAASRQYKESQLSRRQHKESTPLLDDSVRKPGPAGAYKETLNKTSAYENSDKRDKREKSKWMLIKYW